MQQKKFAIVNVHLNIDLTVAAITASADLTDLDAVAGMRAIAVGAADEVVEAGSEKGHRRAGPELLNG